MSEQNLVTSTWIARRSENGTSNPLPVLFTFGQRHRRQCMNRKWNQESVRPILSFYSQGHSQRETMEKFGITKHTLEYLVARNHVTNGRTLSEINRDAARGANKLQKNKAIARWSERVNKFGFDVVKYHRKHLTVRCRQCGTVFSRYASWVRAHGIDCPGCKEIEREAKRQERMKAKVVKVSRFDQVYVCIVCGKEYTPRQYMNSCGLKNYSNPGYCSKTCKVTLAEYKEKERRETTGKKSSNHYARARKLGLPREKGITLKKLISKNGLQCQICGMFCDPTASPNSTLYPSIDHIVPIHKGGGHTWDNVQIAHRICNSNKRDIVGKEFGNVKVE